MIEKLIKDISNIGYKAEFDEKANSIFIYHYCNNWRIKLYKKENYYDIYMYYRTSSWVAGGDRTDIHEIMPTLITLYCRLHNIMSFRFVGEQNEFSEIESELYGMFILPSQPLNERIRLNNKDDFESFFDFLYLALILHHNFYNIFNISEDQTESFSYDAPELDEWKTLILNVVPDPDSTYNLRTKPDWFYFRSYSKGITVIKCKSLVADIKEQYNSKEIKIIEGVKGNLHISENISNVIYHKKLKMAQKILRSVENESSKSVVVQENRAVLIGQEHLIIFDNDGDIANFQKEKINIRERHADEAMYLFNDKKVKWNVQNRQDSSTFEDLVLELLYREPGILSAKKVAPTFQGDNGRDIICEYDMNHHTNLIGKGESLIKIGSLIVQCKTNLLTSKKQSIGKSDVSISDTIYDYQPNGYLLVVNTQTTRDLTEYLEKIKSRKELDKLEWWGSFDLEEKLRRNPDIMSRYSEIVTFEK